MPMVNPTIRPGGGPEAGSADRLAIGCLFGLIVLESVMLAALFAHTEPHPPPHLAPFIGAGIAVGAFAVALVWSRLVAGFAAALLFGLFSLMSFGPHKLFVEDAGPILPAVIVGFALTCVLIAASIVGIRRHLRRPAKG